MDVISVQTLPSHGRGRTWWNQTSSNVCWTEKVSPKDPPPMYPSLFQNVMYPDKPQSSCHAILHDGNSSIGTLHSTISASHQHNLHNHSCSNLEYARPPSHEYSFRSSPIHFDPPHYELEWDCLPDGSCGEELIRVFWWVPLNVPLVYQVSILLWLWLVS